MRVVCDVPRHGKTVEEYGKGSSLSRRDMVQPRGGESSERRRPTHPTAQGAYRAGVCGALDKREIYPSIHPSIRTPGKVVSCRCFSCLSVYLCREHVSGSTVTVPAGSLSPASIYVHIYIYTHRQHICNMQPATRAGFDTSVTIETPVKWPGLGRARLGLVGCDALVHTRHLQRRAERERGVD